jgi:hypothetical protein
MNAARIHPLIALAAAVWSFALLAACTPTVTITPVGPERTYPATPDSVAIPLYTITKPECAYEELAAITAEGGLSEDALVPALRAKARAIGGQAIIGYTQSHRSTGDSSSDISVRSGTAIRFRSDDCRK